MKTDAQLRESIDRFQRIFWDKESGGRPPLGVVNTDVFLPVKYLKRPFLRERVVPLDVSHEVVQTDYEFAFAKRPVNIDDWIPFSAPWRAIPWLEAWCGCPVNFSSGSLAPGKICENIQALTEAQLPARNDWFSCLKEQIQNLVVNVPNDCWVSPTILRGCSDVISAMRGMEGFFYDLLEKPEIVERVAERINLLLMKALDQHFSLVKPKHGGYGHILGYWAPEPTVAIQEMVIESNGPPLIKLLPVFREILERSRLLIFGDNRFDELANVLQKLPTEGLYVVVPETYIKSDAEYREFISAIKWKKE